MKRIVLAVALMGALTETTALAADMAVKAPPISPAPEYNWTGFYIGANAGYGWKDHPTANFTGNDFLSNALTCGGVLGGTCVPPASFSINGPLGGLQVGYNWQINQSWLLGVETDLDLSNIKGTGNASVPLPVFPVSGPLNFQASENIKWFGTLRGRVGFLTTNNLLLYATGGLAYGRIGENASLNYAGTGFVGGGGGPAGFAFACAIPGGAGATNCLVGNSSRTETGYTLGGGAEYAISKHLSLKAEFLYVNLGHGDRFNIVAQSTLGLGSPSSFAVAYSTVDFYVARGGVVPSGKWLEFGVARSPVT